MSAPSLDPIIALSLRASLSLLFAAAAWHKLRDLPGFRATLGEYRVMPEALLPLAVPAVVAAEAFVAVGLWLPGQAAAAAAGALMLLTAYSGAIGLNLLRGRAAIDCGCLGPASDAPLSGSLLARNGLLFAVATALLLPVSGRALTPFVDGLTAVGTVAVCALLFLAANQLAAFAARGEAA